MLKSAGNGCFQPFAGLREREIVVPDEKNLSMQKPLNNFKSGNCLTYFEKLKHGLPRYQIKRQQKTKQTKYHCTI